MFCSSVFLGFIVLVVTQYFVYMIMDFMFHGKEVVTYLVKDCDLGVTVLVLSCNITWCIWWNKDIKLMHAIRGRIHSIFTLRSLGSECILAVSWFRKPWRRESLYLQISWLSFCNEPWRKVVRKNFWSMVSLAAWRILMHLVLWWALCSKMYILNSIWTTTSSLFL